MKVPKMGYRRGVEKCYILLIIDVMLLSFLLLSPKADFLYFVNPNQSLLQPDSFAVGGQII